MTDRGSVSNASAATGNLGSIPTPLIHEVTALLEKERTLMELKLLEKEVQANKWKGKYEDLKDKIIVRKVDEPNEAEKLEKLGEVEDEPAKDAEENLGHMQYNNVAALLLNNVEGNFASFNNIPISKQVFSGIVKSLFGLKSQYPELKVVSFRNCTLDHSSIEAIEYLLRSPRLEGLDIARNQFDDDVLFSFVEVLNSKRKTPQYLLMHGMPAWAHSERAYLELLQTLSKETWGLSISLLDMITNPRELIQKNIHVAKKKGQKEEELLFRDIKQPYRMARFLQALRMKIEKSKSPIDGLDMLDPSAKNTMTPQRLKMNKKKLTTVDTIGRFNKVVPRLADNINTLSVLGLTEYPFSSFAVKELELLLYTVQDTLTELDLSFSYIGVQGAAMLETFLLDSHGQLISLRLKGNLLGDPGFKRIGQTLKTNKTLTYLDVSNNCISWAGLEPVRPLLINTKTLLHLDLTHNEILRSDTEELDNVLRDLSSCLFVRWYEDSKPETVWRIPRNCSIIQEIPRSASKLCQLGRRVLLARFNLTDIYFHHPRDQHKPLVLRWSMRPAPQRSYEDVQREMVLQNKSIDAQNIDQEPFVFLNVFTCFGWEVSVSHNRHEYFHDCDDISEDFHTRDLFCEGQEWVANSLVVKDPPSKGTVDIYGYVRLKQEYDRRGRPVRFLPARQFMRIEWKDMVVYPMETSSSVVPGNGWFHVGGDPSDMSPFEYQDVNVNRFWHYQNFPLLKEHFLLRGLTWMFPIKTIKIVFEAKLCVLPPREESNVEGSSANDIDAMFGDSDEEDDEDNSMDLYDEKEGNARRPPQTGSYDPNRIVLDRRGRPKMTSSLVNTTFDFDCFFSIHRRYQDPVSLQQFRCSQEVKRLWKEERRIKRLRRQQCERHGRANDEAKEVTGDETSLNKKIWPENPTIEQLRAGDCEEDDDAFDWWRRPCHGDLVKGTKDVNMIRENEELEGEFDLDDHLYAAEEGKDGELVDQEEENMKNQAEEETNPLLAWRWQKFVLYATDVECSDTLFLSAMPCIHGAAQDSGSTLMNTPVITSRQKKLLAQLGIVARNVQIYSYIGDAQRYDRLTYARVTPTLLCPEDVFSPFLLYEKVDRDAEDEKRTDASRHIFEAYGVNPQKVYHQELADVLKCPDVTVNEKEMKAFQERAMAMSAASTEALKNFRVEELED